MDYIRESRKRHATGTVVTLYDTNHPDNIFDPAGGRWVVVCEDHGAICNFDTIAMARFHAPCVEWCEECMGVNNDPDLYESIVRA